MLQEASADQRTRVFASFLAPKTRTFWLNPLQPVCGGEPVSLRSLGIPYEPVEQLSGVYRVMHSHREALTHSKLFTQGCLYIQNVASMYAPWTLAPQPGERVLDLAAAPGGKTILMAALMQNQGVVAAVEVVKSRFFKLKANLQRYGVTIAQTYLTDGRTVGRKTPGRFDRVLLDAPCSSEARFSCHDPATWSHWSVRKIKETSKKQKGLIVSAYKSLKVGGTLLYCTCSFAPEENEQVIQHLLGLVGEDCIEIEPIHLRGCAVLPGLSHWGKKQFHPAIKKACRILPDREVDGFFLCKLRKVAPSPE